MANIFLKLSGITGESKDTNHKEWIEVMNVNYSVFSPSSADIGGGSSAGTADPGDLTLMAFMGAHTPDMTQRQFQGKHFDEATFEFMKQGGADTGKKFFTIKLKEVFITHYSPGDAGGQEPMESYGLTYNDIEIDYLKQNEKGNTVSVGTIGYNRKENKTR